MTDKSDVSFPDDWDNDFFQPASKNRTKKGEESAFPEVLPPKSFKEEVNDLSVFPDSHNIKKEDVASSSSFKVPESIERKLAKKEATKSHKNRLSLIKQFVQAFNEISPLVDVVSFEKSSETNFKTEVTQLFGLQSFIVNLIGGEWELDGENINDKYILSIIAKQTSELIRSGFISEQSEKERIIGILDCIDEFITERPYIGQLIDNNQLSEDILVNVKTALFPSSLKFHRLLEGLAVSEGDIYKWVKWHHKLTVNLAKDLAFNWDKSSSFKDRERLFESSLIHCAEIAQDVWESNFIGKLKTTLTSLDDVSLWSHLSAFEKAVENCDMGYLNHDVYSMDWLKSQVCQHIVSKSNQLKSLDISKIDSYKLQMYFVDCFCQQAAISWSTASDKAIAEISGMLESMSEEEQATWMNEEGSKPMPLSKMYAELDAQISKSVFSNHIDLDEQVLLKNAKSKLAMLWGLSDAVCKIKRRQ